MKIYFRNNDCSQDPVKLKSPAIEPGRPGLACRLAAPGMPDARSGAFVRSGVLAWWPLVWPDMLAGLEL